MKNLGGGEGEDNPPEKDPNQGVIDAVGGLGNNINEQTNAIKENTETNKNIFQKLLELPRSDSRTLFKHA